jgi:hypothetical protein
MNSTDEQKQAEAVMNLECCQEVLATTMFSKVNHPAVNELSDRIHTAITLIESMLGGKIDPTGLQAIGKTRMRDALNDAMDS